MRANDRKQPWPCTTANANDELKAINVAPKCLITTLLSQPGLFLAGLSSRKWLLIANIDQSTASNPVSLSSTTISLTVTTPSASLLPRPSAIQTDNTSCPSTSLTSPPSCMCRLNTTVFFRTMNDLLCTRTRSPTRWAVILRVTAALVGLRVRYRVELVSEDSG